MRYVSPRADIREGVCLFFDIQEIIFLHIKIAKPMLSYCRHNIPLYAIN